MNPTRRGLLQWLSAIALLTPLASYGSVRGESAPVSLVGFGGAGHRILRRLVELYPAAREVCRVDLVERRQVGGAVTYDREPLGLVTEGMPRERHVIVAGLGYVPGGESSFEFASTTPYGRRREVRGVLVLPFAFEGDHRDRGLAQAARFVRSFPDTTVIDNEWFLSRVDEERLVNVYERANAFAVAALAQLTGLH